MLNGLLILSTDRYAIGDVIEVNGMGGGVEDMNVYTTSLRNLDGQLIVIPNSKISAVINSSKDWSRVNFTVRVAWDADLLKTIEIIQQVMEQLQSDPELQEKILEPGEILGIDEVSHEGILIRMLIKTQPKEQWFVGRKLRIRLKQAFDAAGISLGVPQREIWHHHENGNKPSGELSKGVYSGFHLDEVQKTRFLDKGTRGQGDKGNSLPTIFLLVSPSPCPPIPPSQGVPHSTENCYNIKSG